MLSPLKIIEDLSITKKIMSDVYRDRYKNELNELEYRINNNAIEQKLKLFDYFISHTSFFSDNPCHLSNHNIHFSFDNLIYLSIPVLLHNPVLVCDATLMVIRKRIEESKAIIWVESQKAYNSIWVKYELNYSNKLNKLVYYIKKEFVTDLTEINKLNDYWFLDEAYEEIKLY